MSDKLKYPGGLRTSCLWILAYSLEFYIQFPEIKKFSTLAELAPIQTSVRLPAQPVNQTLSQAESSLSNMLRQETFQIAVSWVLEYLHIASWGPLTPKQSKTPNCLSLGKLNSYSSDFPAWSQSHSQQEDILDGRWENILTLEPSVPHKVTTTILYLFQNKFNGKNPGFKS